MTVLNDFLQYSQNKHFRIINAQIYQNDQLVAEKRAVDPITRLNVYSVSKSITSIGVGLACQENLLKLTDPIYQFFPQINFSLLDPKIKKVTIRDLLTMTAGLKDPLFFADDPERYLVKDWIRYYFTHAEFVHEPGKNFLYSTFNSYILSCIVESATGATLVNYLKPRFFEPIGIGNPDWLSCPMGHTMGAHSLMLTIDEMSKIGLFLLHKGKWQGKQILNSQYLEAATSNQVPDAKGRTHFGYGYQYWINPDYRSFRADGKLGQFIIVLPQNQLVVSIQSLEQKKLFPEVWEHLIQPLVKG